ncbi:coiled-coil domain-containing protein 55-domain containing protein [Amylostereum chailletii]|nr:coiled-coil domain-containing protein 55-domain containing protein [Amylostereum chailletii]
MKLSFSFKAKTKETPVGASPSLKRPAAFASLDDESTEDAAASLTNDAKAAPNSRLIAQNAGTSRTQLKRMAAEQAVDETVYQYDEVWDNMQEAKLKAKAVKEHETKERKPKYIGGLLNSAATRRLDHLRAEEKMMQRERELEGDEFADKEAFVTQAYKDQQAEVRKAEEEERQRDELEKKKRGPTSGMAHFYRQLLNESEQQHEATVAATQTTTKVVKGPQGPIPNLTITKPPDFSARSDVELAQEARAQGKDVELNDDNQIVDKRELLSAGLNLSAPNTRQLGLRTMGKKNDDGQPAQVHTAVGTAASRREINERRQREIETQLREERERAVREKERAERETTARIVARRNDEAGIQSAVERYRERKRRKLEADAAAAASQSETA